MKLIKNIITSAVLCLLASTVCLSTANAQSSQKNKKESRAAEIKNLIDSQRFVFLAQTMAPLRGITKQLNYNYSLKVSGDTIVSYLPYYGRAFIAPVNPTNIGFDFTSTKFDYKKSENKKGGWDIIIRPKDQSDIQQMTFTIYNSGSAYLNISSVSRDPISFDGYITAPKERNRK